jgi:hypothetical protein
LLDWERRSASGSPLFPFHLTLEFSPASLGHLCVTTSPLGGSGVFQVQQLHSHDFFGERHCDPSKGCGEATSISSSSELRLLTKVEGGSGSVGEVPSVPYLSIRPCEGSGEEEPLHLSSGSRPPRANHETVSVGSVDEDSRQLLEELISHLVRQLLTLLVTHLLLLRCSVDSNLGEWRWMAFIRCLPPPHPFQCPPHWGRSFHSGIRDGFCVSPLPPLIPSALRGLFLPLCLHPSVTVVSRASIASSPKPFSPHHVSRPQSPRPNTTPFLPPPPLGTLLVSHLSARSSAKHARRSLPSCSVGSLSRSPSCP